MICPLLTLAAAVVTAALPPQDARSAALKHEKAARAAFGDRIESTGAGLFLRHGASRLPIGAIQESGDVTLETPSGRVIVPSWMPAAGWLDRALDAMPRLLARVGPQPSILRLHADPLLGPHVWCQAALASEEHTLRAFPVEGLASVDMQWEVGLLKPYLDQQTMHPLARRALVALLDVVVRGHGGEGEPDADLVLRLVGRGWLRGLLPASDALDRFERAAPVAGEMRLNRLWLGNGVEYSQRASLMVEPAGVLRDTRSTRYLVELASWNDLPALDLVVEQPPRADPVRDAASARAASLWLGPERVAHWTVESGFAVDAALWERVRHGARSVGTIDRDYLPPHLPVVALDGALAFLVTRHGVLRPPRPEDPDDFDRFVTEAARVLPDPAHLDLLREHFFHYVHDSPDNLRPQLIGVPGAVGEIHQTWRETLATTTGGRFRGDCDDLAEVFAEVARAQGRLAHIMDVPGHNALAFAERRGTVWTVRVLHTGEPLAFGHRDLKQALAQAYRNFQDFQTFDPAQVPIAVRFSGERQRSQWLLSWRIFADARYAEALIDVQHDWHLHTYGRGLAKMEAIVAAGDDDAANHLEIAGLSEQMGEWGRAADEVGKALQQVEDPLLVNALRLIDDQYRAGQVAAGRESAGRLLTALPDFRRRSSVPEYLEKSVALVALLVGRRDLETALRVLQTDARGRLSELIASIARTPQAVRERRDGGNPSLDAVRAYVETALDLLLEHRAALPPELAAALLDDVKRWVESIAASDVENDIDFVWRDATIGRYWLVVLGPDLDRQLARRGLPAKGQRGQHGSAADLPWIKASLPFWFDRLTRLFGEDRTTLDRAEVARLARAAAEAHATLAAIDVHDDGFDFVLFETRLLAALAQADREALVSVLAQARRENDKQLRDAAAEWIGEAARFLTPEDFGMVLDVWDRELGYKPLYLAIAWAAQRTGAGVQARMAAQRAADRFPDEPAFEQELSRFQGRSP